MATLTYDPSEPQDQGFTPEEQDSLEVGERLAEEQNQLLAGKFQSAEDLEKAYTELQSKLGERNAQGQEQGLQEPGNDQEEVESDESESDNFLDELWDQSMKDDYDDDFLQRLSEYDSADIAQMFLDYKEQQDTGSELTSEDVSVLTNIAGGAESYKQMISWAGENLNENEINMYDTVMAKGDPLACFFAVQALNSRFQDAAGVDGQLISGRDPETPSKGFRSQAELVRAIGDPRYETDPAYRNDVMQAIEKSNVNF